MSPQAVANMMSALKIDGESLGTLTDHLFSHGYLEVRSNPDVPRRTMIAPTSRGFDAYCVIRQAIQLRRWARLPFRADDIVISAVSKSGTTWLQMICALLIFQTPDLPAPLPALSPWLDYDMDVRDEVVSLLAAQRHRRFIKTHLSLSEIPMDPRVRYLVILRHPLDLILSHYHMSATFDEQTPQMSGTPRSARQALLEPLHDTSTDAGPRFNLSAALRQLADAWAYRDHPNVLLLHYEDLAADLAGEMRRIATWLEISVPEPSWSGLVRAASFEQMRAAAGRIQPMPDLKDPGKFFHSGTSGAGRGLLEASELDLYYQRAAQLLPPDLMNWLHREYAR